MGPALKSKSMFFKISKSLPKNKKIGKCFFGSQNRNRSDFQVELIVILNYVNFFIKYKVNFLLYFLVLIKFPRPYLKKDWN